MNLYLFIYYDKNGVGDNTGVRFSNGEYIYIRRNAVDASPLFVEGSTGNKAN